MRIKKSLLDEVISKASCGANIASLKVLLEHEFGIFRRRFNIVYKKQLADDGLALHDLNTNDLIVIIQEGQEISVAYTVEDTSHTRTMKFIIDNKIEDLMNLIKENESIPLTQQELIYNGTRLPTAGTVAAAGIVDNAMVLVKVKTITVQFRFPDGVLMPLQVQATLEVNNLITVIKLLKRKYAAKAVQIATLLDGHTLGQLNVQNGSCFDVEVSESRLATVYVRMLAGKTITYQIDLSESVLTLMQQIYAKEGSPPAHQKLLFDGNELDQHKALSHYGIKDQSTVYLIFVLKGC